MFPQGSNAFDIEMNCLHSTFASQRHPVWFQVLGLSVESLQLLVGCLYSCVSMTPRSCKIGWRRNVFFKVIKLCKVTCSNIMQTDFHCVWILVNAATHLSASSAQEEAPEQLPKCPGWRSLLAPRSGALGCCLSHLHQQMSITGDASQCIGWLFPLCRVTYSEILSYPINQNVNRGHLSLFECIFLPVHKPQQHADRVTPALIAGLSLLLAGRVETADMVTFTQWKNPQGLSYLPHTA